MYIGYGGVIVVLILSSLDIEKCRLVLLRNVSQGTGEHWADTAISWEMFNFISSL